MRFTSVPLRKPLCGGALTLLLAAALPGGAATPAATESARFQRERALCMGVGTTAGAPTA